MKYLRKPADFASAGNYVAPGKAWDTAPRYYLPTDSQLVNGADPDTANAAEYENGRMRVLFDAQLIQAHAAMKQWTGFTIPVIGTDQYISVVGMRNARSYGSNPNEWQRQVIVVGRDGGASNKTRLAHCADGSLCETAPPRLDTIATFTLTTWGVPGAAGELILINNGSTFAYSTDSTNTWALSAGYGGAPNILAAHYDSALGYIAVTTSTVNCFRGTTIPNLSTSSSSSTIATPAGSNLAADEVDIASNGAVLLVAATTVAGASLVYRSTNGGATWSTSLTFNGSARHCNVTYSDYWGLFVAWCDTGEMFTSSDGSVWVQTTSSRTPANGFSAGRGTLVSAGAVIAKPTSYASPYGTQSGVVYSFDLGATWNYTYFNEFTLFTFGLRAFNNRIYATGQGRLFRSGILGAPSAEI